MRERGLTFRGAGLSAADQKSRPGSGLPAPRERSSVSAPVRARRRRGRRGRGRRACGGAARLAGARCAPARARSARLRSRLPSGSWHRLRGSHMTPAPLALRASRGWRGK